LLPRTNQDCFLDGSTLHFFVNHNLQYGVAAAAGFVALSRFHGPVLVAAVEELHCLFDSARRIPARMVRVAEHEAQKKSAMRGVHDTTKGF
jgi:hypothetical protein